MLDFQRIKMATFIQKKTLFIYEFEIIKMNRFIVLLTIFATLASFAASTPLRRDDLSGFKQCERQFLNTVTSFSFSPNPVIPGKNVTVHIGGEATETVVEGALLTFTG